METSRNLENFESQADTERDCPRCSQPLGSNPDCNACAAAAKWSPAQRESLIQEKRRLDKKFLGRRD